MGVENHHITSLQKMLFLSGEINTVLPRQVKLH